MKLKHIFVLTLVVTNELIFKRNWSLHPSVKIMDLVSHITYFVCACLKTALDDRFLGNFQCQCYLLLKFLSEIL